LLNTWLTGSKAANNVPFLQQLLLTLQHLPLTVDHLKQVWGHHSWLLGTLGGLLDPQVAPGDITGGFWTPRVAFVTAEGVLSHSKVIFGSFKALLGALGTLGWHLGTSQVAFVTAEVAFVSFKVIFVSFKALLGALGTLGWHLGTSQVVFGTPRVAFVTSGVPLSPLSPPGTPKKPQIPLGNPKNPLGIPQNPPQIPKIPLRHSKIPLGSPNDWMGVIRSQSSSQPTGEPQNPPKFHQKHPRIPSKIPLKSPHPLFPPQNGIRRRGKRKTKAKLQSRRSPRRPKMRPKMRKFLKKKREKPKSLRTTAPSHAKFRSTDAVAGAGEETELGLVRQIQPETRGIWGDFRGFWAIFGVSEPFWGLRASFGADLGEFLEIFGAGLRHPRGGSSGREEIQTPKHGPERGQGDQIWGPLWNFGVVLVPFLVPFWGWFWCHFWFHFGVILVPFLVPFWGWFWCNFWFHFGVILVPFLVPFWGWFWCHSGSFLGQIWAPFGGRFGTRFGVNLGFFAMEGLGFLDALNSAPVPGIKIKKKKKVLSPTAAKPSPFEGKPAPEPSTAKPSSPEPAAAEPMDTDRPGTPPMDTGTDSAILGEFWVVLGWFLWVWDNLAHFGVTLPRFGPHFSPPRVPFWAQTPHFWAQTPHFWAPPLLIPPAVGGDPKATDVPSEGGPAPRRTRKKKSVSWPEEGRLREYFYFELDETERGEPQRAGIHPKIPWRTPGTLPGSFEIVSGSFCGTLWAPFCGTLWVPFWDLNVNKIKDFGEAAKREMLKDRHAFETARRLSHDSMEEKVPWIYPKALELPAPLVIPGSGSRERFTQAERVKGILQEIFLSFGGVSGGFGVLGGGASRISFCPTCWGGEGIWGTFCEGFERHFVRAFGAIFPHEPDPESYEPLPPKLIPLDEDCSGEDGAYPEGLDPGNSAASPEPGAGAKLPPVLANLMGSVGAGKGPPGPPQNAPINMQEILSSIMVTPGKRAAPNFGEGGAPP
ncbi:hypothetical protein DV515_00018245, partial [Chloebia gouldiae]